jgi:hypothetical protein
MKVAIHPELDRSIKATPANRFICSATPPAASSPARR